MSDWSNANAVENALALEHDGAPRITDALGREWMKPGTWWVHDDGNGGQIWRTDAAMGKTLRDAEREAKK